MRRSILACLSACLSACLPIGLSTCLLALLLASLCTVIVPADRQGSGDACYIGLDDGEYAIEFTMTGGSGKASILSPTLITVEGHKGYVTLTWSSSNYDYMIVEGEKYLNLSGEDANSEFVVPVTSLDGEMPVIADTLAMGTPHEVQYSLTFLSDSISSKSQLPQEGAKRVLWVAGTIIIGGGILNHFVQKRRRIDYLGTAQK